MIDPVEIRLQEPNDRDAVRELLRGSFGEKIPDTVWDWLHDDNGFGKNLTYVGIDRGKGKLFGSYSLLPIRIKIGCSIVQSYLCNNVNVHPDYRGAGQLKKLPGVRESLFVLMGRHALAMVGKSGAIASLGVPNAPALPGHLKVGWERIGELDFAEKSALRFRGTPCRIHPEFDVKYEAFAMHAFEALDFAVWKPAAFQKWRLTSRPLTNYTILFDGTDSGWNSYCVLKVFIDPASGTKSGHIVDFLSLSKTGTERILEHAESLAAEAGCERLDTWLVSNGRSNAAFLERGFALRNAPRPLILYRHQPFEMPERNWSLVLADNDVY